MVQIPTFYFLLEKKVLYSLSDSDGFDREELPTYEEVSRLFPRSGWFRPLVLVGPPGVGRNEIKRRIVAQDADRYRNTIPREWDSGLTDYP